MKRPHYLRLFFCSLVLLTVSCNKDKQLESVVNASQDEIMADDLTVETAQQWFESKVNAKPNGRIAPQKEPMWAYATQSTEKNGTSVVIVPVTVAEKDESFGVIMKQEVAIDKSKDVETKKYRESGLSTPQKLVMFKDSKGKVQTLLMKVVADIDYFESSLKKDKKRTAKIESKDFDGSLFFYDWAETKIIEGLRYENGKLKQVYSPDKITKNGKLAGCTSWEYIEYWPPVNNAKTAYSCRCSVTTVTSCSFDGSESSVITVSMVSFGTGGGGSFESISTSYRQNKVDNFISQAAQYGASFNPDERLDFIDNFGDFLKVKDGLLEAIKSWGSQSVQQIEGLFCPITGKCLNNNEKSVLQSNGLWSYKINLIMYLYNARWATLQTKSVMNNDGRNGNIGSSCSFCRGNAYKHATFAALNSNTFNENMARALGQAHENNPTNPSPQNEINMDLHNNEVGFTQLNSAGQNLGDAFTQIHSALLFGLPGTPLQGLQFIRNGQTVWTHNYTNED